MPRIPAFCLLWLVPQVIHPSFSLSACILLISSKGKFSKYRITSPFLWFAFSFSFFSYNSLLPCHKHISFSLLCSFCPKPTPPFALMLTLILSLTLLFNFLLSSGSFALECKHVLSFTNMASIFPILTRLAHPMDKVDVFTTAKSEM